MGQSKPLVLAALPISTAILKVLGCFTFLVATLCPRFVSSFFLPCSVGLLGVRSDGVCKEEEEIVSKGATAGALEGGKG